MKTPLVGRIATVEELNQALLAAALAGIRERSADTALRDSSTPGCGPGLPEESLLLDIERHPLDGVRDRIERLGVAAGLLVRIKADLEQAGLIEAAEVRQSRGRPKTILGLTRRGVEHLERRGVRVQRRSGCGGRGGGLEHAHFVQLLAAGCAAAGIRVHEEARVGEGFVDLLVVAGDFRTAVEVETGEAEVEANVEKVRAVGDLRLLVAATRPETLRRVERAAASRHWGADVRAMLAWEAAAGATSLFTSDWGEKEMNEVRRKSAGNRDRKDPGPTDRGSGGRSPGDENGESPGATRGYASDDSTPSV